VQPGAIFVRGTACAFAPVSFAVRVYFLPHDPFGAPVTRVGPGQEFLKHLAGVDAEQITRPDDAHVLAGPCTVKFDFEVRARFARDFTGAIPIHLHIADTSFPALEFDPRHTGCEFFHVGLAPVLQQHVARKLVAHVLRGPVWCLRDEVHGDIEPADCESIQLLPAVQFAQELHRRLVDADDSTDDLIVGVRYWPVMGLATIDESDSAADIDW
jgi:hypothetical protein